MVDDFLHLTLLRTRMASTHILLVDAGHMTTPNFKVQEKGNVIIGTGEKEPGTSGNNKNGSKISKNES